MRVLVTGADGFVGRHLCEHLRTEGDEVVAYGGPRASEPQATPIDIRRESEVLAMVADARADSVVHLAGWASVGSSYAEPTACFEVNALGACHVLEAIRKLRARPRFLLISSGEVYGEAASGGPRSESDGVFPKSPYGVSKLAAELLAGQYCASYGIDVVIARAFNHVGKGQDERFVIPALARQTRDIAEGRTTDRRLKVGNLDPVRDFTSVLDVVEAYRLLLQRGVSGETYNVCSGEAKSIREMVNALMLLAGVQVELVVDPDRVRASDISTLVGDPRKINALGWRAHRAPLHGIFDAT